MDDVGAEYIMSASTVYETAGSRPASRHQVLRWAVLIAAGLAVLFLFFFRLADYPAPWYDEGSHLHVAKNYALNGIYADYSSEGIRYYGPAIAVGPTALLPIAAVFSAFGVSIPLARVVIAIYGLLALAALYGLGRQFLGVRGALAAVALLLLSPGVDFVYHSRTVLGEIPGIFFVAAGLWLWLKPQAHRLPVQVAVGVLLGLACITKNQFALFILPAMLAAWIADLVWYKQRGWRYFVVPGALAGLLFAGWTYIVLIALGEQGDLAANLATLRSATAGAFFQFKLSALQDAVTLLIGGTMYGTMFFPALAYGVILALRRNETGQRYGILVLFILSATALFVTSIGWPRYAFPAAVLTSFLVIRVLQDATSNFTFDMDAMRRLVRGETVTSAVINLIVIVWAFTVYLLPTYVNFSAVITKGRGDAYLAAQYLDTKVPQDALIETWEQELAVLTNHNYHYPPQIVLAHFVAQQWSGGARVRDLYDFREYGNPDYLVMGEFGKFAMLYPPDRLQNYELIHTVGVYDIFRRKD